MDTHEALRLLLNAGQEPTVEQRREIGGLLATLDNDLAHYKNLAESVGVLVRGYEQHVRWLERRNQT